MADRLDVPVLIGRKRDGEELSEADIRAFMTAYLAGDVAEEQMSALLMAGVINGFTSAEAAAMTEVMVASGDTVDLSALRGPTVDKHSTGGVGDSTTLVVAPVLAACGVQLAKLSGRGLGHTGGTLDKLEAIPGFRVALDADEMARQVNDIGCAVAAATANVVPLDKRLYALRDVTGTVPSPALIAASVMSKKLASGAQHILLDVKTGNGAFMEEVDDAVRLAQLCVDIGHAHDRATGALITDMSQPLAPALGNALEVDAALRVLTGAEHGRLAELSARLGGEVLSHAGVAGTAEEGAQQIIDAIRSGAAAERFGRMVYALGGPVAFVENWARFLPEAPVIREVAASADGVITAIDGEALGMAVVALGGGRQVERDVINPAVGLSDVVSLGDVVSTGQPLARVHAAREGQAEAAAAAVRAAVSLGQGGALPDLVRERVA